MIKIPKEMLLSKIKEKAGLSDKEIESKVKDKLDQLSGLISEEGALHIIANELGVKVLEDAGQLQVKNVLAGMRNVELSGKVVKIYEVREFNRDGKPGQVGNFLIGDETGVIRVVAWNDKAKLLGQLNEGDTIKILNGYSRDNRGKPEVHLGDRSEVKVNPDGVKINVKTQTDERKKIAELGDNDQNVEIMGTVVQVFDPRFFTVDPESGKRAVEREGSFYVGDTKIPEVDYSYVTNLFLDDGTENIRVVMWKNQTQNLFGKSHDEILQNRESGFEEIKNDLLGQIVKLRGRTNKNEMFDRVEFIANFVDAKPNPEEEMKRLEKELKQKDELTKSAVEKVTNEIEEIKTEEIKTEKSNDEIVPNKVEDETEHIEIPVNDPKPEPTLNDIPESNDQITSTDKIDEKTETVEIDLGIETIKKDESTTQNSDNKMDDIDEIDDIEDLSSI
jgi:hypothetical protein